MNKETFDIKEYLNCEEKTVMIKKVAEDLIDHVYLRDTIRIRRYDRDLNPSETVDFDTYKVRLKEDDPEDLIRSFSDLLLSLFKIASCIDRENGKVRRERLDSQDLKCLDRYLFMSDCYTEDPDKVNQAKLQFCSRGNELEKDKKILEKYDRQTDTLFKNSFIDHNDRMMMYCCDEYLKRIVNRKSPFDVDRIEKQLLLALFLKSRCKAWRGSGLKESYTGGNG